MVRLFVALLLVDVLCAQPLAVPVPHPAQPFIPVPVSVAHPRNVYYPSARPSLVNPTGIYEGTRIKMSIIPLILPAPPSLLGVAMLNFSAPSTKMAQPLVPGIVDGFLPAALTYFNNLLPSLPAAHPSLGKEATFRFLREGLRRNPDGSLLCSFEVFDMHTFNTSALPTFMQTVELAVVLVGENPAAYPKQQFLPWVPGVGYYEAVFVDKPHCQMQYSLHLSVLVAGFVAASHRSLPFDSGCTVTPSASHVCSVEPEALIGVALVAMTIATFLRSSVVTSLGFCILLQHPISHNPGGNCITALPVFVPFGRAFRNFFQSGSRDPVAYSWNIFPEVLIYYLFLHSLGLLLGIIGLAQFIRKRSGAISHFRETHEPRKGPVDFQLGVFPYYNIALLLYLNPLIVYFGSELMFRRSQALYNRQAGEYYPIWYGTSVAFILLNAFCTCYLAGTRCYQMLRCSTHLSMPVPSTTSPGSSESHGILRHGVSDSDVVQNPLSAKEASSIYHISHGAVPISGSLESIWTRWFSSALYTAAVATGVVSPLYAPGAEAVFVWDSLPAAVLANKMLFRVLWSAARRKRGRGFSAFLNKVSAMLSTHAGVWHAVPQRKHPAEDAVFTDQFFRTVIQPCRQAGVNFKRSWMHDCFKKNEAPDPMDSQFTLPKLYAPASLEEVRRGKLRLLMFGALYEHLIPLGYRWLLYETVMLPFLAAMFAFPVESRITPAILMIVAAISGLALLIWLPPRVDTNTILFLDYTGALICALIFLTMGMSPAESDITARVYLLIAVPLLFCLLIFLLKCFAFIYLQFVHVDKSSESIVELFSFSPAGAFPPAIPSAIQYDRASCIERSYLVVYLCKFFECLPQCDDHATARELEETILLFQDVQSPLCDTVIRSCRGSANEIRDRLRRRQKSIHIKNQHSTASLSKSKSNSSPPKQSFVYDLERADTGLSGSSLANLGYTSLHRQFDQIVESESSEVDWSPPPSILPPPRSRRVVSFLHSSPVVDDEIRSENDQLPARAATLSSLT